MDISVGASIDIVGGWGHHLFTDDDNDSIPLAVALKRPIARRGTLSRTATGVECTYGNLGESFNFDDSDGGWTETAALAFGRIVDGSRVTATADPDITRALVDAAAAAAAAKFPKQDTKDAAAADNSAHSLGDAAGSATAVVTAPEPVAPAPPAAAAQPPPAGPTAQETPVRDPGGDSLARF